MFWKSAQRKSILKQATQSWPSACLRTFFDELASRSSSWVFVAFHGAHRQVLQSSWGLVRSFTRTLPADFIIWREFIFRGSLSTANNNCRMALGGLKRLVFRSSSVRDLRMRTPRWSKRNERPLLPMTHAPRCNAAVSRIVATRVRLRRSWKTGRRGTRWRSLYIAVPQKFQLFEKIR